MPSPPAGCAATLPPPFSKAAPLSPHCIPGLRRTMLEGDKETLRSLTDLVFGYFITDTS